MPTLTRRIASGTIQARLLTIALVPSVAALLVGTIVSGFLVNHGLQVSGYADKLSDAAGPATRFVTEVQDERRLTLQWLSAPGQNRAPLNDARAQSDDAMSAMEPIIDRLDDNASGEIAANIQQLRQQITEVSNVRSHVDSGFGDLDAVYGFYNGLLDSFGMTMRTFARAAPDSAVAYEQVIAVDLFDAADAMSRGHALAAARTTTGMTQTQFHEYIHQIGAYHEDLDSLVPRMTPEESARYDQIGESPSWKQLDKVQDALEAAGSSGNSELVISLPVPLQEWQNAAHDLAGQLTGLYRAHSDHAAEIGRDRAASTLFTSLMSGVAVLVVAVAVFFLALRLSHRLITRLSRLREETLGLAERELPSIVRRLRDGERIDIESQVAWLNHGDDEIGQVANAFNQAQQTAISATVQEAETRQGVRSVFLNIAHRSQVMVHRQLQALDKAERSQEDPDQLEMLFQLDHLATQSRRNAENLIILGGERPGRQWRNPVALPDVVVGAVAEIERYTRVEVNQLPGVEIQGAVVADLIHLLAELLDNATSFSPPESYVTVHGNVVGKGVVVEIEDQGLGIEADKLEQLNAMLRTPPDFGVMAISGESRMGLFVVAQLAARHEIKIALRESVYGGIRALALIPTAVLANGSTQDAHTNVGAWPTADDQQASQRPRPLQAQMSGQINPSTGQATPPPLNNGRAALPTRTPSNGQTQRMTAPGTASLNPSTTNPNGHAFPPMEGKRLTTQRPEPPRPEPQPRPATGSPTGPVAGDNGSGPATAGGKKPLPQRQRQANLAAPLRANNEQKPAPPDQSAAPDSAPAPRTPEQFRATMSAVQYGTRRGRGGDGDAPPGSGQSKGEQA